jgi:hypothetical protein
MHKIAGLFLVSVSLPALAPHFVLAASTPGLIQCPDAAAIIAAEQLTKLRTAAPAKSFDKVVAASAPVATQPLNAMKPAGAVGTVSAADVQGSACVVRRVTVQHGDTAFNIAQTYMGDGKLWPKLIAANPSQHGSPFVYVRSQLSIPCTTMDATAPSVASGAAIASATQHALAATAPAAAPASPEPAPLPVWTARSGEYLTTVVRRWARVVHYSVVVATTADWKLAVPFRDVGTFEEALKQLVVGFQTTGAPPYIQLFPNNVLKIGGSM